MVKTLKICVAVMLMLSCQPVDDPRAGRNRVEISGGV